MNDVVKLNDVLRFDNLDNVKIRLITPSGRVNFDPYKEYTENKVTIKNHLYWRSEKNVYNEGNIVVGLLKIDYDRWLLVDVAIIDRVLGFKHDIGYEGRSLEKYENLLGHIIVKFKNRSQNVVRHAKELIKEISVVQIVNGDIDEEIFPGYDSINIGWRKLEKVLKQENWKTALRNIKGVYLITDIMSGKRYVGSAYGNDNMILGRWESYISNGHGGNKDLKELDFEYIKENFRYSILEIFKPSTNDEIIIGREHWWMDTLLTKNKQFGFNNK